MKTEEAFKIIGGPLSKPNKMPGWSTLERNKKYAKSRYSRLCKTNYCDQ